MAELGEATVNRILHQKSCSEGEYLKELLNSRNNEEIVNHLKDSNRPREDFQVLQNTKGRRQKKNGKKAVRLTAWVDPPPPPPKRSGKCEIFLTFDFRFTII